MMTTTVTTSTGRIPCFLLEPVGFEHRELGRTEEGECAAHPGRYTMHSARWQSERRPVSDEQFWLDEDDPRWPTTCDCGYPFTDGAKRFGSTLRIHRRADTGEEMLLRDAPAGAMWFLDHYVERFPTWDRSKPWHVHPGPDNRVLCVRTPGGDWIVDSRANNCTMPQDNEHACWVRTGEPPNVTAGKDGPTCAAGAGSIGIGDYHGFLRDGWLVRA